MKFKTFEEFYPVYLSEHSNLTSRKLHFVGTSVVIILMLTVFLTGSWPLLIAIPVAGYGCAWVGHFFFEKNRPLTFKHPFFSLMGDFRMFWDILTGKLTAF